MFQSNQKLDNLDFSKFNNIIFHGLQTANCTHTKAGIVKVIWRILLLTVTLGVLKEMKF